MSSLNRATIIGRLGADPEIRYTQNNTAVANFSVATSERYKDSNGEWQERPEWHRIVAWAKLAEVCENYLRKGALACFEGPLQTRSWEDNNGVKKYATEIKALNIVLLSGKSEKTQGPQKPQEQGEQTKKKTDEEDDDLPF